MFEGKIWKIRTTLRIAVTFALLILAITPVIYIKLECKAYSSQNSISDNITISDKNSEADKGGHIDKPIIRFSVAETPSSPKEKIYNGSATYYAVPESFDWWRHFLCEINGADYVLAYFTFVLAISTIFLWLVTERTLSHAQEASSRDLRAYVSLLEVHCAINRTAITGVGTAATGAYFWMVWKNAGKTPAMKLRIGVRSQTFPMNEDRVVTFSSDGIEGCNSAPIGPGVIVNTPLHFIPIGTLMEQWQRETEIILWARIEYRDVLNPDIQRFSECCMRVEFITNPEAVPIPGNPGSATFMAWGPQNDGN